MNNHAYSHTDPEAPPYILLRAALQLFDKSPADLDENRRRQAERQAVREHDIETRVLRSPQASGVVIPPEAAESVLNEIVDRYPDREAFMDDLVRNHLSETELRAALLREIKVNTLLERIAANAPEVSEVEIGIFYHSHPGKFRKPETRVASHILISINPDFPENNRSEAFARISQIARRLRDKRKKFGALAQRYSECPTALKGGSLGNVPQGMLFPQLDHTLFKLRPGEISGIVESEMGFHLLLCEKIHPEQTLSLEKAAPSIRRMMQERYRRICQRNWLAQLCPPSHEEPRS